MATQTIAVPSAPLQFPQSKQPQSVPAKEPITQLELELLLSLRKRADELAEQVAVDEAMLRSRIECGATVEPGRHTAELQESFRRNVAWKSVVVRLARRLKLDGEKYCEKVLAGTTPTKSVSLVIH